MVIEINPVSHRFTTILSLKISLNILNSTWDNIGTNLLIATFYPQIELMLMVEGLRLSFARLINEVSKSLFKDIL